ncbi:uncharacterized protein [Phyllobates terribilis]|uniref:uncharacterized protein n=1 Tax=Phyllobates terribilis TaxID=111132 RepID=UPI003CCB6235
MKIAIAFALVALSCLFDSGNAILPAGGKKGPIIPRDCLKDLITKSLPKSLWRLQELLCLFMSGRKTQNKELYKKFLCELHQALIDTGCAADQILSLPQFLEKVGDEVGELAEQIGCEIFKLLLIPYPFAYTVVKKTFLPCSSVCHMEQINASKRDMQRPEEVKWSTIDFYGHNIMALFHLEEDLGVSKLVLNTLCGLLGETLLTLSQSLGISVFIL